MQNLFADALSDPASESTQFQLAGVDGTAISGSVANENSDTLFRGLHSASLLNSGSASATGSIMPTDVRGGFLDTHQFVRAASDDGLASQGHGIDQPDQFLFSPQIQNDGLVHPTPVPQVSPTQDQETAFIAGVNASSQIVATSFGTWNSDNPATFKATSSTSKWGGAAGTAGGTVSYYFQDASTWSATEKAVFIAGLTLWSDIANIQFVAAPDAGSAQLTIIRGATGSGAFQTGSSHGTAGAGTVGTTNLFNWNNDTQINIETGAVSFGPITANPDDAGGHVWGTVVHEEGHELGLGHGGAYNGNVIPATQQFSAQDTTLWSIMSYIEPTDTTAQFFSQYPVTGTNWGVSGDGFDRSPQTFMPLDVLAAQALYGLPVTTAYSGGQIFGFNTNITDATKPFYDFTVNTNPVVTIWDAGTNNTLDLSGFTPGSTINLNPGTFSSANGMVNNIAIAFSTVINTAVGGPGNDTFILNNNGDFITTGAGNDTITGGSGNDSVFFGVQYTSGDHVDGGAGTNDQIGLQGNYSGLVLSGAQISNVEVIALLPGFNYSLSTDNALVAAGQTLTFWSVTMAAANSVSIDGSAELDGKFNFYLGHGNDTATGGAGNDVFYGEGGSDTLRGNAGADTFAYLLVSDSTSTTFDKILDFTHGTDTFKLPVAVTGVDATIGVGALATVTFDTDLALDVNATNLAAHHAVLFTPTGPDYAGHTFLIVDANGTAGYQAGADFVFDVTGGTLTGLSTADFTM